ncbi:MAG: hypothetical protein OES47_14820 [Acidobacteriota bacterium]|nr:hypothetical protein [Acidobacteriota bacterium]
MLEAIRKTVPIPELTAVALEVPVAVVTAIAFVWLLAQGAIQPLAVYLLELYLLF